MYFTWSNFLLEGKTVLLVSAWGVFKLWTCYLLFRHSPCGWCYVVCSKSTLVFYEFVGWWIDSFLSYPVHVECLLIHKGLLVKKGILSCGWWNCISPNDNCVASYIFMLRSEVSLLLSLLRKEGPLTQRNTQEQHSENRGVWSPDHCTFPGHQWISFGHRRDKSCTPH